MRRAYVDIPEGQMHYRYADGGGENVVLLHMSGSSSEEYEGVGDILAARGYRVFAMDLLGFGVSDKPSHYYYSMDEHIVSILAFMNALGINHAYVWGNMATANMAARMSACHPDRVKGLFLCHPLYHPDPEYYRRRGRTAVFCRVDPAEDGSHLQELWRRSSKYGDAIEVSDRRCADLLKAGEWGETLHWALHEDSPFASYLDQLNTQTVIVAYDFLGDPALLKSAAERLSHGTFVLCRNATPYIPRAEPERIAELFCEHFQRKADGVPAD